MHSNEPFTALGIDVGGTKIAAGVVCFPAGELKSQQVIATRPERSSEEVLNDTARLAEALSVKEKFDAIGVALCELVDGSGQILSSNCLKWTRDQLRGSLGHLGPVTLDADVRAAAQAEAQFGAARNFRIFFYVTVGTGISSCLMVDGKPYLGARGLTGTMASSAVSVPCEKCGDSNTRTLEEIAAGPGLVRRYGWPNVTAGREVLAAAEHDESARDVVRSGAEALGGSIGALVSVLDPEAVIIGGGLGLSEGLYWDTLYRSIRKHIWSDAHRDLPILRAATGRNAGVIGAALAAWRAHREK